MNTIAWKAEALRWRDCDCGDDEQQAIFQSGAGTLILTATTPAFLTARLT